MSKRKKNQPWRGRVRWEGCYKSCGRYGECHAENHGLCPDPETLPVWSMSGINEGVDHVSEVRFPGRPEPRYPEDEWGGRLVYEEPTMEWQRSWQRYPLYDPMQFQEAVLDYPPLYDVLLARVKKGDFDTEFLYKDMTALLRRFFESVFEPHVLAARPTDEELFWIQDEPTHWERARKTYFASTMLIAKCLVAFYFSSQSEIIPKVSLYANLPLNWQEEVEERMRQRTVTAFTFKSQHLDVTPTATTLGELHGTGIEPKSKQPGKSSFFSS